MMLLCHQKVMLHFWCGAKHFVFLSASPRRWSELKKHVTQLTVKPLSDTRWESRIDSIRPFRFQAGEIYDAL
jgi:nitrate reductase cytochrome c-type subunit